MLFGSNDSDGVGVGVAEVAVALRTYDIQYMFFVPVLPVDNSVRECCVQSRRSAIVLTFEGVSK